ncbi:hypothetical protein J2847_006467 [Azospirillum agricola]|uniref:hypothetical protein n=1 Tax=Azospirillum agricola TaxID=1720247 RepID=UPI001AE293CD|nr:hypothetical protein [Azospirillum agricola]MBP2233132.1 hypothetical protein [Azospirillum agricola]
MSPFDPVPQPHPLWTELWWLVPFLLLAAALAADLVRRHQTRDGSELTFWSAWAGVLALLSIAWIPVAG